MSAYFDPDYFDPAYFDAGAPACDWAHAQGVVTLAAALRGLVALDDAPQGVVAL